nr:RsmD family RNA methyltransferase [Veillonella denticariosi]
MRIVCELLAELRRGHAIKAPKGMDTRPTLDRVRESVFNVLANRGIYGTDVLDLFSGTGAVAIESLSRGAARAVAVDCKTGEIDFRKCRALSCR